MYTHTLNYTIPRYTQNGLMRNKDQGHRSNHTCKCKHTHVGGLSIDKVTKVKVSLITFQVSEMNAGIYRAEE